MPANLSFKSLDQLSSIKGVSLGVAEAGIKQINQKDLLLIVLDEDARVAGVFTQNRFCAAPVKVAKEHISRNSKKFPVRALIINTGSANAGTGEEGVAHAKTVCVELARLLNFKINQVLPFSTGVIMESLPVEKIISNLPKALADLKEDNWYSAAQAILTTDTVPKSISKKIFLSGSTVTITGIAKGSGMIRPNMATMLCYLATDAAISQPLLQKMIHKVADKSFNRITVDGDTSTNDAFILIATGYAGNVEITETENSEYKELQDAITEVAEYLAKAIVKDGEGATKFITVKVEDGKDTDECAKIAYAIAHSPLVKTAFFASDPNLGRIIAAIGYAGVNDLDINNLELYLDDVLIFDNGRRAVSYSEKKGARVMSQSEITVRVVLNRGNSSSIVWTCDFSYDYIKINSDYRS